MSAAWQTPSDPAPGFGARNIERRPEQDVDQLAHPITNTMPTSPFGKPLKFQARATRGIKNSRHASNMEEILSGEPGAQGTHMDALGHFGAVDASWNGADEFPVNTVKYYGGHTQAGRQTRSSRHVGEARHRQGGAHRYDGRPP